VKNVELLEVTLAQLGGEEPATGFEETIRGIRYRVVQVPPQKRTKSSKWRRREPKPEEKQWRLLVQEVQDGD
jgi:hypothetical protein